MISLPKLEEALGATEPVQALPFNVGPTVKFEVEENWNAHLEEMDDQAPVGAMISVGSQELQFSKAAFLEATSAFGMPKGLAQRTPGDLLTSQLNYWFGEGEGFEGREYKVLRMNDQARAFTKASLVPFSNLKLLEAGVNALRSKYGSDAEIVADYKFVHTLHQTDFRLIVPEYVRAIDSAHSTPETPDNWSTGLAIRNSLSGVGPTELSGYLFRYWCTNGAIDTLTESGKWSRRGRHQDPDDVYSWAETVVNEVLGGLEHSLDKVNDLTKITLEGNLGQVREALRDVFTRNRITGALQDRITMNMADESDLSMYAVMNAITAVANDPELSYGHVQQLMAAGGELAHLAHDRCGSCHRLM